MYSITIQEIQELLKEEKQLREVVSGPDWLYHFTDQETLKTNFHHISYNSKEVDEETLFFCKGLAFKEDYLKEAVANGVSFYISEKIYDVPNTTGIIVSDIRRVMAVIAKAFYDEPDKKLKIAGITGTKGKTTTTYFTKYILDTAHPGKVAMISTIEVNLDGKTSVQSELTTPEALDLYRMLATAAENNMEALIMEVSSQAFKMDRVYGLNFDIGVFLNISPDHIGPNEHPNMEDYFYCKRQLVNHSKYSVINANTTQFELIYQQAKENSEDVFAYGKAGTESHYYIENDSDDPRKFQILDTEDDELNIAGDYTLQLYGDFNKENALCAAIVASLLDASKEDIQKGLAEAYIPGRMERYSFGEGNYVYVDFAHNYMSIKSLLDFVTDYHPDNRLTIVLGAPGGKGVSRRKDMGKVLSNFEGTVILTEDDPNDQKPREISEEIAEYIEGNIKIEFIDNRQEAIEYALGQVKANESIVIAGKGNDKYQIVHHVKEPYLGDDTIVKKFINKQK